MIGDEPAATSDDVDAAVEIMVAAGVTDTERYRRVLELFAEPGWPASYIENIARRLVPVAHKWEVKQ